MFNGCSSLEELYFNNFNNNNETDMRCIFDGCSSLKELIINNFNTNDVTDMSYIQWKSRWIKIKNKNSI